MIYDQITFLQKETLYAKFQLLTSTSLRGTKEISQHNLDFLKVPKTDHCEIGSVSTAFRVKILISVFLFWKFLSVSPSLFVIRFPLENSICFQCNVLFLETNICFPINMSGNIDLDGETDS